MKTKPVKRCAYPFGEGENVLGEENLDGVKNLNLKTATTTRLETIYKERRY